MWYNMLYSMRHLEIHFVYSDTNKKTLNRTIKKIPCLYLWNKDSTDEFERKKNKTLNIYAFSQKFQYILPSYILNTLLKFKGNGSFWFESSNGCSTLYSSKHLKKHPPYSIESGFLSTIVARKVLNSAAKRIAYD